MVRGSQPENLSKLEKLPQFSFDFTGDFNRKIVLFWKHKNYKTCETAIYAFHHHSQTHFAHRRFNIAVAFFFFQCNLAVPLYLICPCLFIYFFFFPLSHTVKCSGLSLYGCSWLSVVHSYRASTFILFITAWLASQSLQQELTGTWVLFQLKDKTVLPETCISTISKRSFVVNIK